MRPKPRPFVFKRNHPGYFGSRRTRPMNLNLLKRWRRPRMSRPISVHPCRPCDQTHCGSCARIRRMRANNPSGPYQSNPRQRILLFGAPRKRRRHPKTRCRKRSSPQRLCPRRLRPLWSFPRCSRIRKRVRNPFSIVSGFAHVILAVTTIAHAPKWLLNACNALDFLTTEHPKTMTTIR